MTAKAEVQRVARLALWLSTYWYNLQHSAGDSILMKIADAMSRLSMDEDTPWAMHASKKVEQDDTVPFNYLNVHQILAS